jgi:PAS domain S-box-containing protein
MNVFTEVFHSSKSPVYFVDKDNNVIWTNEEFRNLTYFDGGKCFEIVCGFDQPCPDCPAQSSFESASIESKEIMLSNKKHRSIFYAFDIVAIPVLTIENPFAICIVQPKSHKTAPLKKTEVDSTLRSFAELSKEEGFVLSILEAVPFAIVVFDELFRFLDCNSSAENIFHFKANKKVGENVASLIPIPENYTLSELLRELRERQSNTFNISHFVNSAGDSFDLTLKYFPIFEDSKLRFIVLSLWKIDMTNPPSINLQRSMELFQQLFERIPTGLLVFDEVDILHYANNAAKKLFEKVESGIGKRAKDLDIPVIEKLLASNKEESEIVIENSKTHIIEVQKFLLPSRLFGFGWKVLQFNDITSIRQLEKELGRIRDILSIISTRFEGLVLRLSNELKVIDVFGSVAPLLGVEREELLKGKINWLDLIHHDDVSQVSEIYREAVHFPNYTRVFRYRLVKVDGNIIWVEDHLENITDSRGKIVFLQSLIYDVTERITVEEQLKNSQNQLRNLALYFESLREEEKKNLAFEIHDELGHVLTAMKLELSWVLKKKHLREEVLHEKIVKMIEMIESTIRKVRSISSQLRPSVLDHFGIVAAIEWQAMEFQKQTAIRCRLYLTKQEVQLDERVAIAVFRIFQEILTNVARHANATRVDVHLEIEGNNLVLTVSDNGRGIKSEEMSKVKSLGIVGMKERANAINGKLTIQGVSNVGTTVTLTLPIN